MTRYLCKSPGRVAAVRESTQLNGIDYLEVVAPDQTELELVFVHPLPGQPNGIPASGVVSAGNWVIEGGERIRGVEVISVSTPAPDRLRLKVDQAGDFSPYTLRMIAAAGETVPPAGFDPRLATVEFSFKAGCPSPFDCREDLVCPPQPGERPEIDYLAKDYGSFRRLMLDRLGALMPGWTERSPADPYVAVVEALAATADRLSYLQDATATEAYLGTARSRVSLRRHARLIDYRVHDGCNALTFVRFEVAKAGDADKKVLPAGTPLATRTAGLPTVLSKAQFEESTRKGARAFETLYDVPLDSAHNDIAFYTWSDADCCLPAGATDATLLDEPTLTLAPGAFLVLEQTAGPETGERADADPAKRHVVQLTGIARTTDPLTGKKLCEVTWDARDALPFSLPLTVARAGGETQAVPAAAARGNLVPADHGLWVEDGAVIPEQVPDSGPYRPMLGRNDIIDAPRLPEDPIGLSARVLMDRDPRACAPVIRLTDDNETWRVRADVLASDRFAADVVAERDHDGVVTLRFGDGVNGRQPAAGSRFQAAYRIGAARDGAIGARALAHVLTAGHGDFLDIQLVTNPLPAVGAREPETAQEIRSFAPASIKRQARAVTEQDYARAAEQYPEVQRAAARIRWSGSWYTVFVTIDRLGGRSAMADTAFRSRIFRHLDRVRMAGYDLELRDPIYLPLDLRLRVCVAPGYFKANVKAALLRAFGRGLLPDGRRAFFHPDNFSFGDPVYASRIHAAAMETPGVSSVALIAFQRWSGGVQTEIPAGEIVPADNEIVQLDNDPNYPEHGRFDVTMLGGL
jgi:hypothetical protein